MVALGSIRRQGRWQRILLTRAAVLDLVRADQGLPGEGLICVWPRLVAHARVDDFLLADDGSVVVQRGAVRMTIRVSGADAPAQVLRAQVLCGLDDPPAGWVSREFDRRCAAPLLLWRFAVSGPRRLTTRIDLVFLPESGPSAH